MNAVARIFFVVLLTLAASSAGAREEKGSARSASPAKDFHKIALVVGNAAYVNALPLSNPLNDANDVCAALRKLDFEVICKLNIPSKREFKDAIFEFTGKINEKTVALFYFAGHGLQIDGLNYLIPTNAVLRAKSDIEDESVQVNYLMSELEARRAALNIFLLDACRDNPFVSPIRGYAPTLGLASQLYIPRNSILAMSTGPGQLSLDGTGRNGTFTKNLLKFVLTPRQSVEDMLKAVNGGTSLEAQRLGRRQDPQITISYADRYCLAGCTEQSPGLAQASNNIDASSGTSAGVSAATAAGLDAKENALLRKEQELNRIRDALAAQQAGIDVKNKELRTRTIEAPPEQKKAVPIIPAF